MEEEEVQIVHLYIILSPISHHCCDSFTWFRESYNCGEITEHVACCVRAFLPLIAGDVVNISFESLVHSRSCTNRICYEVHL